MDQAQIAHGKFMNDSEYIRDLIQRNQDCAKFQTVTDAIQERFRQRRQ